MKADVGRLIPIEPAPRFPACRWTTVYLPRVSRTYHFNSLHTDPAGTDFVHRLPEPRLRETLTSDIKDLKQRIAAGSFRGEAEISRGVVTRILHKLGWPVFDVHIVTPEFRIGKRKADYALCHPPGQPSVLLEVKDLGKADGKGEKQLFEYCFHQGVPIAVLTDGRRWDFFFPAGQGSYQERRFARIDLVDDEPEDSAKTLLDYLQARDVQSGKARNRAHRDHEAARQKKEAASKYTSVWRKLLSGPESLLLDLFCEEVEQVTGVRPDRTGAAEFIRAQAPIAANLPTGTKATKEAKQKPVPKVDRTREMTKSEQLRYRFFEGLLHHAKSRTQRHANVSPKKYERVDAGAGTAGVVYSYHVLERNARVELRIDTRDGDENQRIFEALSSQKERIEGTFGGPLEWVAKEGRQARRIRKTYETGGYRDEDKWEVVYEELATAMAKLESAVKRPFQRLRDNRGFSGEQSLHDRGSAP